MKYPSFQKISQNTSRNGRTVYGRLSREIQAKIASTKKTGQITGAMQMVSASNDFCSEQAARNFKSMPQKN